MTTGLPGVGLAAKDEVAQTVEKEPGRLRRYSAAGVLALLGAAALVPVVIEAVGGAPLATAFGGVVGNVGGGYLSGIIETMAERLRNGKTPPEHDAVRDRLAASLLAALEKNDRSAQDLANGLTGLLIEVGGIEAALAAAGDDLRGHLRTCFAELAGQQRATLRKLDAMEARQRRQGRQLREQAPMHQETVDRLRWLTRELATWSQGPQPGQPGAPAAAVNPATEAGPTIIVPSGPPAVVPAPGWRAGAEMGVGDRRYLIDGYALDEHFSASHAVLRRQARGLRLIPSAPPGQEYVWLRQVEARHGGRPATAALAALAADRELLSQLGPGRGVPGVVQFQAGEQQATLVLTWPSSRAGRPCATLGPDAAGPGAGPMEPWRMFRLLSGLVGLTDGLARLHDRGVAHRQLTPDAIVVLGDGRYALRDLGLASQDGEPGEGPARYQAPEQQHRGRDRPGPGTDVYQLAAIAYHLIAGRPPLTWLPPPLSSQSGPGCEVPDGLSAAIDAALAPGPADRPGIREFGARLRSARDEISGG